LQKTVTKKGGINMKRRELKGGKPWIAPGMEEILEKNASAEQKKEGKFTRVTRLSYDEEP
jgi:hypothetical protein